MVFGLKIPDSPVLDLLVHFDWERRTDGSKMEHQLQFVVI
jgi:hypothetical protein